MYERLSVLDTSFITRETLAAPLHVGGLTVFSSDLHFDAVAQALRRRMHLVPLGRRKPYGFSVNAASATTGRPVWVDDADFDLSYHLRHSALPPPGDDAQLHAFLARLMQRRLDRSRPLWEIYVIEGLEGGAKVGVFRKTHLAMAGGDRGDPFAVLLDEAPEPPAVEEPDQAWAPSSPPGPLRLAVGAARDTVERAGGVAGDLTRLATHPTALARAAAEIAGDTANLVTRLARPAPPSPLNTRLSSHRRLATLRTALEDYRRVRSAFGGTVNDVVIAVASDAIGRLLRWRGHDTKNLDLRVMVPVRVHEDAAEAEVEIGEAHTIGNGVVGVVAPLPVMRMDPVARLYRIMGEMAGLKESRQAVAASNLVRLAGFATPNLHAAAARLVSAEQRYNVALSNAPGPQQERYLAGTAMQATYPFIPLAGNSALSIAVSSYVGDVTWGLVGERDAMEDLDLLRDFVVDSLQDLVGAAGDAGA